MSIVNSLKAMHNDHSMIHRFVLEGVSIVFTRSSHEQLISKPYKADQILPVLTADQLLAGNAHQAYIEEIFALVDLPDEHFNALYLALIHRFAEFVQLIPKKPTWSLGSFLNKGLQRAWRGLILLKEQQSLTEDPARTYLVYSALLLRDLSALSIYQKVVLCDEEGIFQCDWTPASGSMVNLGPYYRLFFCQRVQARLAADITVLLARQLMPVEGFDWLASDDQHLVDWLLILREEDLIGGVLAHILQIVKLEEEQLDLQNELPAVSVKIRKATATALGEAFLVWLQEGIAKGDFSVNQADAGLHRVAQGLFIEYPDMFRRFSEQFNKPLHVVFTQFGNLFGFVKQGGQDYRFDQFFSAYGEAGARQAKTAGFGFGPLVNKEANMRKGIILNDVRLAFAAHIPEVTAHLKAEQVRKTAIEQLPPLKNANTVAPGFKKR